MKTIKKLLAGAAVSAMMMSAHAGIMNIGGVYLDPASAFDFGGTTAALFQNIDPVTGALSGYGTITRINNTDVSTFCPGCEVTVVFDGYAATTIGSVPTIGGVAQTFKYNGGSVRLYIDYSPDTNGGSSLTLANASDGVLWLGMVGHADQFGDTLTGENGITTTGALTGKGSLDVLAGIDGGLAGSYLDTNTRPLLPNTSTRADLSFSASFTTFLNVAENVPVLSFGTANFDGDTQVKVPEPGSLALLGLGLAGIASIRRRKTVAK